MLVFTRFVVPMWYVVITIMAGLLRDIIVFSYLKELMAIEIYKYLGDYQGFLIFCIFLVATHNMLCYAISAKFP